MFEILLQELRQKPLLMASHVLHAMEQAFMNRDSQQMTQLLADPNRQQLQDEESSLGQSVAVVPVTGILFHRPPGGMLMSVTTYQGVVNAVRSAVRDDTISEVVLDIHSPGGMAAGCFEASEELAELAQEKRVTAVINEAAFSGAYMLAAACTERVLPKSASVGSIGVVMTHLDVSKAAESMGFKFTHLFRGRHKVDGTPYEPLSDQAKAEFDKKLDQSYGMFTSSVSKMIGLPEDKVRETEAREFIGEEAVSVGLADRVVQIRDFITEVAERNEQSDEGGQDMPTEEQKQQAQEVAKQAKELGLEVSGLEQFQVETPDPGNGSPAPAAGGETPKVEDITQAKSEGEQAALTRFGEIQKMCTQVGRSDLAGELFQKGLSVEQARTELFNKMAGESEESSISSHLGDPSGGTSEAQEEAALLETAVGAYNARAQRQ